MKAKKFDIWIVFLLAFITRMLLIILYSSPLRTPLDEMCTMATGAYFGGKDWGVLTSFCKYYYGGGFTILFAPLFYVTNNANIIYTIILGVCALLQSISAPISYYIMKKYLKVENRWYLFFGSLACSFMVVTRVMEVYNEHIVIACVWIITLILCKLIEHGNHKKKHILYTVLLMFVMGYMLTTHARTKVIWIAMVIIIACYLFVYKKWLVHPIVSIFAAGVSYQGAVLFNTMVKTRVWRWHPGMSLRNTEAKMEITLEKLKDPINWHSIFSTIFGQVNTVLIFSGSLFALILVLLFVLYKHTLIERFTRKKELFLSDEKGKIKPEAFWLVISCLFVMCIGAVMFAQCFTWLKRVVPALESYGTNAYGFKAITYVRYVGPFLGPVFMVGLSMIYNWRDSLRKYLPAYATLHVLLQLIWCAFILPYVGKSSVASEVYNAFSSYRIKGGQPMKYQYYVIATAIVMIFLIVYLISYYKKKIIVPMVLTAMLLTYQYVHGAVYWDAVFCVSGEAKADAGTSLVLQMEEEGVKLPKNIHVVDVYEQSGIQRNSYAYQMILNDYHIYPKAPEDLTKDNFVFSSNAEYTELIEAGFARAVLDDNEYLYVKGDSYIEMFTSQGVVFEGAVK